MKRIDSGTPTEGPASPLVSVIIPTLNEARHIEASVAAARRGYGQDQVEVIVVDGGSSDGTPERVPADETLIRARPGRAVQVNRGAAVANGEMLVFCHGDSQLPPRWRQPVIAALSRANVSGGSFAIRLMPARGILHLLNVLRYPADWRLMYGDQAQFMRRETFEHVGGFPEIPAMEDLEMMRQLNRLGRLVRIPLPVTSSSRRFLERGPTRQLFLDVSLVVRYLCLGATAEEIARDYYGRERG
jgi:rSAM/selenodomain-associated transferase 2